MARTYYDILGLQRSATADEIKSAFRRLAMQWHPDRNKAPSATARFREINEAYECLFDPIRRRAYDATLNRDGESRSDQRTHHSQSSSQSNSQPRRPPSELELMLDRWNRKLTITPELVFQVFARAEAWLDRVFAR